MPDIQWCIFWRNWIVRQFHLLINEQLGSFDWWFANCHVDNVLAITLILYMHYIILSNHIYFFECVMYGLFQNRIYTSILNIVDFSIYYLTCSTNLQLCDKTSIEKLRFDTLCKWFFPWEVIILWSVFARYENFNQFLVISFSFLIPCDFMWNLMKDSRVTWFYLMEVYLWNWGGDIWCHK